MGASVGSSARRGEWAELGHPRCLGSVRGICPVYNQALAHLPRAPWEQAHARSLKPGKQHEEENSGKVQVGPGDGVMVFVEYLGSHKKTQWRVTCRGLP